MMKPQVTTPLTSPMKAASPSGPFPLTVGATRAMTCNPTTM